MNFNSAPDRHRWLSSNSMMVAAKLATSFRPNWRVAKLGDIAEKISTGTTPPSQERRYYDGEIDWYTPADIGGNRWLPTANKSITNEAVSEKKARTFDPGTILITCIGHIGRVGILSKTSSANQQITGIKFNSNIDAEFAYYGLFARQDELNAATPTASTLSILNQNRLAGIDFCFPDLAEQKQISRFLAWCEDRLLSDQPFTSDFPPLPDYLSDLPRIVARIVALVARVAQAQSLRREASGEAESIIYSARNDMVTSLRKKYADVAIGDVCVKITDGPHVSPKYVPDGVSGIPFISVRNVSETGLDFSTAKYVSEEDHKTYSKKAKVEKSDVLYTKGGTTGVARRVDTDQEFSIWVHVALLKLKKELAVDGFIEHMLNSPSSKAQALKYTHGSSNKDLGLTRMCNIVFPLPPLEEQRRLVAYLDGLQSQVSALRVAQAETERELSALMPSVLDK